MQLIDQTHIFFFAISPSIWDNFFRSVKVFLLLILIVFTDKIYGQGQIRSYSAQTKDISEIQIPASAEVRNNFNLYYQVKISNEENINHTFWYKFVFAKDTYFNLNVFPLIETDRYEIFLFKKGGETPFCDSLSIKDIKVFKDFKIRRTYDNDEQSEQFRATLLYTKNIEVKANDVIYLEVVSIKGKDCGHIVDFHTQANSFVMKIINDSCSVDLTNFYNQRNASLAKSLNNPSSIITPFDVINLLKLDLCDEKNKMRIVSSLNMSGNRLMTSKKSTIKNMEERKVSVLNKAEINRDIKKPEALVTITKKDSLPLKITPIKLSKIENAIDSSKLLSSLPVLIAPEQIIDSNYIKQIIKEETERSKALQLALQGNNTTLEKSLDKALTTELENLIGVKCLINDPKTCKNTLAKMRIHNETTGENVEVLKDTNGGFEFLIEKGKKYKIEVDAVGYKSYDKTVVVSNHIDKNNIFTLKFEKLKVGDNFVLKNIFFHPNTAKFKPEASVTLEQLYNFMSENKDMIIEIDGHTNGKKRKKGDYNTGGADRSNYIKGSVKKLSKARAEEVKNYLIKRGINQNRIKTKGLGGGKPIFQDPETAEEGLKNMRVEVLILGT